MTKKKTALIVVTGLLGIFLGWWSTSLGATAINITVSKGLQDWQPDWLVKLSFVVSLFEFVEIILVIPLVIRLWRKNYHREAIIMLAAGLAWFPVRLLKQLFGVACPDQTIVKGIFPFHQFTDVLIGSRGGSVLTREVCYPSGHVFSYVSVWGMAWFLKDKIWVSFKARKNITVLGIIFVGLVGVSRIVLGAHYLTDVVGGYLWGSTWLLGLILILEKWSEKSLGKHKAY